MCEPSTHVFLSPGPHHPGNILSFSLRTVVERGLLNSQIVQSEMVARNTYLLFTLVWVRVTVDSAIYVFCDK